jgi:hypothetical protein
MQDLYPQYRLSTSRRCRLRMRAGRPDRNWPPGRAGSAAGTPPHTWRCEAGDLDSRRSSLGPDQSKEQSQNRRSWLFSVSYVFLKTLASGWPLWGQVWLLFIIIGNLKNKGTTVVFTATGYPMAGPLENFSKFGMGTAWRTPQLTRNIA